MNKRTKLITAVGCALLIIVVLIVVLVTSCSGSADGTYPTIKDGEIKYQNAAEKISSAENLLLTVQTETQIKTDSETLTEHSEKLITYESVGTQNMVASINETIKIGDYTITATELYADNTGYFTVNGISFIGSISAAEFAERIAPAVPISMELYESVIGYKTKDSYIISFEQATAPEAWAMPDICTFIRGEGTAEITKDGELAKSTYTIEYTHSGMTVVCTTTVAVTGTDLAQIAIPEDVSSFTNVEYLDAPKALERACGYLYSTGNLTSASQENIYCQAFGDTRSQAITLEIWRDDTWSAQIDTTVTVENSGKVGSTTTEQTEWYKDDVYTIATNNEPPTVNEEVTLDSMQNRCKSLLAGSILYPQYITGAVAEQGGNSIYIKLNASEDFAEILSSEACETLYANADILTPMVEEYKTDTMSCYLEIDPVTGLPVSAGFDYCGTYTIDTLPYQLQFTADQQYLFISK